LCPTCSKASRAVAAGQVQPSRRHCHQRRVARRGTERSRLGASSCRASSRAQLATLAAWVAAVPIGAVPRRWFLGSGTPSVVLVRAAAQHRCRRTGPVWGTGQSRHGASSSRATSRGRHAAAAVRGAIARIGAVPRLRGLRSGIQSVAVALAAAQLLLRRLRRARTTRRTGRCQLGATTSWKTTRKTLAAAVVPVVSAWSGAAPRLHFPASGIPSAVVARAAAHRQGRIVQRRVRSRRGASSCRATTRARLAEAQARAASAPIGVVPRLSCRSSGTQSVAVAAASLLEESVTRWPPQQAMLLPALHQQCGQRTVSQIKRLCTVSEEPHFVERSSHLYALYRSRSKVQLLSP